MTVEKNVKELTANNFSETIKTGITLVDFWAAWCMPCRMQGPIIDNIAGKHSDKANICKVNVDDNQDLASKYGVMSIPTLILFKDGTPVKQFVGVQSENTLIAAIKSAK